MRDACSQAKADLSEAEKEKDRAEKELYEAENPVSLDHYSIPKIAKARKKKAQCDEIYAMYLEIFTADFPKAKISDI